MKIAANLFCFGGVFCRSVGKFCIRHQQDKSRHQRQYMAAGTLVDTDTPGSADDVAKDAAQADDHIPPR